MASIILTSLGDWTMVAEWRNSDVFDMLCVITGTCILMLRYWSACPNIFQM